MNRVRSLRSIPRPDRAQWENIRSKARHPLWWLPDPAAEQDEAFRRIWQNLRQVRLVVDGRHDTEEWFSRNAQFVMVTARVPQGTLDPEIERTRLALERQPFTRLHPDYFLHIPILELGFLVEEPTHRDDLDQTKLQEFIQICERPVRDFPRFLIGLGGVNSFADAAFIDVYDDGWLSRIHRRLLDFMVVPPDIKYPYLPILTIAQYTQEAPLGRLPAILAAWRDFEFGAWGVESIDILGFSTSETYAVPEVLHSFPLGTRPTSPVFTTIRPTLD